MTPDEYVESVLQKYSVPRGPSSAAESFGAAVAAPLRAWAGTQLNAIQYSGSYAKETGVHGVSDVDVFVSLKSDTNGSLREIYEKLAALAEEQRWSPRLQNVSVGVTVNGTKGDLVPGRVQEGFQNYHSLYLRKRDSWTQTNVALHVSTIRESGRVKELRAIKIWRMLNGLEFPSLYLELFTIDALAGRSRTTLADNVLHALKGLEESLADTRIVDPANTNNILSDDLSLVEKNRVASRAGQSRRERHWERIIW